MVLNNMEAIEFLKEYQRICRCYHSNKCNGCPLEVYGCDMEHDDAQEIVKIVEKWSRNHPRKTLIQDFFEKFPNAPKLSNGCPKICPDHIYGHVKICTNDCLQCWSYPLED